MIKIEYIILWLILSFYTTRGGERKLDRLKYYGYPVLGGVLVWILYIFIIPYIIPGDILFRIVTGYYFGGIVPGWIILNQVINKIPFLRPRYKSDAEIIVDSLIDYEEERRKSFEERATVSMIGLFWKIIKYLIKFLVAYFIGLIGFIYFIVRFIIELKSINNKKISEV